MWHLEKMFDLVLKNVMIGLFTEAVHMNPLTAKASDDDIEQHIKEWLKYAKERAGHRKECDNDK